jgi:hypothetical protein
MRKGGSLLHHKESQRRLLDIYRWAGVAYPAHKRIEERFIAQEIRILAAVDKRLAKTEERLAKSLVELTKTISEKLGVALD